MSRTNFIGCAQASNGRGLSQAFASLRALFHVICSLCAGNAEHRIGNEAKHLFSPCLYWAKVRQRIHEKQYSTQFLCDRDTILGIAIPCMEALSLDVPLPR
jgi:hypothetical protein